MLDRPSIPEFPRLGGMVLLRLTGALSTGTTLPAINWDPATLWRLRRFAGYTGRKYREQSGSELGGQVQLKKFNSGQSPSDRVNKPIMVNYCFQDFLCRAMFDKEKQSLKERKSKGKYSI